MRYRGSMIFMAAVTVGAGGLVSQANAADTPYQTQILASSPIVYFPMDEAHTAGGDKGATAVDKSGNGHNGIYGVDYDTTNHNVADNVTLGSTSASPALNTAAAVTAGVSDRFDPVKLTDVAALDAIGSGPYSIQFWFKTSLVASTNRQDLFDLRGTNDLSMQVDNGVAGGLTVFGNSPAFITSDAGVISADTWYMVTLTRDASNNLDLYLNGSLLNSATGVTQSLTTGGGALAIGNKVTGSGHPLQGSLDEFAFYGSALSASTITSDYSLGSGTAVPEPASLSLLALGGAALLIRRRRA